MITQSLLAAGQRNGSKAEFLRQCPYCTRLNIIVLGAKPKRSISDGALEAEQWDICRHFVHAFEVRGEGIFFRFSAKPPDGR